MQVSKEVSKQVKTLIHSAL